MAALRTSPDIEEEPSVEAQRILYQQHYNWRTRVPPYEPPPPGWALSDFSVRRVRSGFLYLLNEAIQDVADAKRSAVRQGRLSSAHAPKSPAFYRQYFRDILANALTRERFSCLRRFLAIPVDMPWHEVVTPIRIETDQLFAVVVALLHEFRHSPRHIHTAISDAMERLDSLDKAALTPEHKDASWHYAAEDDDSAPAVSSWAELPAWTLSTATMDRVRTGLLSMIHVEIEALKRLCFACRRGSLEGRVHACIRTPAHGEFYERHLAYFTMILLSPSRLSRLRRFLAMCTDVCAIADETLFAVAVALLHEFTHSPTLVRDLAAAAQNSLTDAELIALTPEHGPFASPYTAEEIATVEAKCREEARRQDERRRRQREERIRRMEAETQRLRPRDED